MPRSRPDHMKRQPAPQALHWTTNEDFATGKGATVQEFVAVVGNSRYVIDVAPWGEGRFMVDGREIARTDGPRMANRPSKILMSWRSDTSEASASRSRFRDGRRLSRPRRLNFLAASAA